MNPSAHKPLHTSLLLALLVALLIASNYRIDDSDRRNPPPTNPPFSDYKTQSPGAWHKITVSDLPLPYATPDVDNGPRTIRRPSDAWPKAPEGFRVDLFDSTLHEPREIRTAPNGDLFVAESQRGDIVVFRGASKDGKAESKEIFARGLELPFGIAFYPPGDDPQWVYVGNTGSVVRFPYRNAEMTARGPEEMIVKDIPSGGHLRGGGHWTRDLAVSRDGKKLYVSVGSQSNVDDTDTNNHEWHRADILEFNPDGSGERVFAYGIRNAVGIAVDPKTGELWASVNERDDLGDNLPPDYITHVQDGGFYGWPWYYMGGIQDPRHKSKHPELKDKSILPDVLVMPHNASLEMVFYEGQQFPDEYRGDIFAAEHGSWNRALRTGYEVIRVPLHGKGKATGEYEDFLTGFVTSDGKVWGRPVGVAIGTDGSLFVTDDESNSLWRVTYVAK